MESTSSMHSLPPEQDLFGRFEAIGYKPRKGQKSLILYVASHPEQNDFNGVLPTGYGKTQTALATIFILSQQGRINRVLVVVPTDSQRSQYVDTINESCEAMGLPTLTHHEVKGTIVDIRAHRENRAMIFVTTVQAILADPGHYADLTATGRWLLFCDEYHKLRGDAAWGKAVANINAAVRLGLTATPIRTDRQMTVFGTRPPDVVVTFQDAYVEQAIRGVEAHIEHYFVDVQEPDGAGGLVARRLTTEEIGNEASFEAYQKSRDLRLTGKYLAGILSAAHDCLQVKLLRHPNQHQMLVFAMSVLHGKTVSSMLNAVYGKDFSDWIGVGPDGRPDPENAAILKRYKKNQLPCLVQVDKAGEGFDNPRSSVLVFLNLLRKETVKAYQQMGRGLRRNRFIMVFEDDVCDVFASPDTGVAELACEFAKQTIDSLSGSAEEDIDGKERNKNEPPWFTIPPFMPSVTDVEFDRTELVRREAAKVPQAHIESVRSGLTHIGKIATDDDIRRVLAEREAEKLIAAAEAVQRDPEVQRERVTKAVATLAGNIARKLHRDSFDKTMIGDYSRLINGQWKRISGLGHNAMFGEDFRRKYEWVQELTEQIQESGQVPLWLKL